MGLGNDTNQGNGNGRFANPPGQGDNQPVDPDQKGGVQVKGVELNVRRTRASTDPVPLTQKVLDNYSLPIGIIAPGYDRKMLETAFVALGGTARINAGLILPLLDKQAKQFSEQNGGRDAIPFGVVAVGFSPQKQPGQGRDTLNTLKASDCLYTVEERGLDASGEVSSTRTVVGCIKELLRMGKDTEKVLDHIASSQVSTVFMSVLAKHYFLDRNNVLNIKNADIAADIANPLSPRTAIGILVAGIRRRINRDPDSFLSVFCAENLPSPSGPIVKQVLLDYCRAAFPSDRQLCDYVKGRVFVPSVSVDRVCPDDTNAFPNWRDEMSEETGIIDNRIIRTEGPGDFEVVIDVGAEDQLSQEKDAREFFILNNPFSGTSWPDQVVITYGDGVKYGITKQRVINATHVVAAMIGTFFLGPDTPVHEVLLHEKYGPMIKGYLENEMIPSLESNNRVPVKRDIGAYAARSWGRLSNPALPDPVFRIDQGVYGRLPRVLQMELELEAKAEEGVFPMAPAVTTAIWTILRTLKLRAGGVAYTPVDSAEVLAQVEAAKEACSAELEKDSVQGTIAVFARLANAEVFGKAGTEDTDFRRKVIAKIREFVPLCYPHKQQNEMVH